MNSLRRRIKLRDKTKAVNQQYAHTKGSPRRIKGSTTPAATKRTMNTDTANGGPKDKSYRTPCFFFWYDAKEIVIETKH